MKTNFTKKLLLGLSLVVLVSGCDTGFKQMGPSEFGVRFRSLPPTLGGGIDETVIGNGQKAVVWPWDSLYRFETSEQYISWGRASEKKADNSLFTRARDGNEVALAVTVVYQIEPNPKKLVKLLEEAGSNNEEVRALVEAVGRADVRTYMNHLKTAQFADVEQRYRSVGEVRNAMNRRLQPYGIEVKRVTLDDFRFERLLKDGSVDASYQEKLTQIQKLREDTNREMARIETIKAKKQKELSEVRATVNQKVAEVDGYLNQIRIGADGYYNAKKNEADAILAQGKAEAEGMVKKIEALSGPGGEAVLKLEIAKTLIASNPKFVVLPSGGGHGAGGAGGAQELSFTKTDLNQLLMQMGVIEAANQPSSQEKK
jgi:hypothetical protein